MAYIKYPGLGKIPPVWMEELVLGKEDVLFHLSDDEPVMIIQKDGSWNHLLGCVLAYVLHRRHVFDQCLQAYLREIPQERREIFMPVLRERGKNAH